MKNKISLISICAILILAACSKKDSTNIKGCTNTNADNYNSEAIEDDGTCSYNSILSIISKRWYRVTDSIVYSFELDPSGSWITYEGRKQEQKEHGINKENAILYHTFNGQEEQYEIIDPTSEVVKFKGGKNATQEIAPENVLLVYNTNFNINEYDYIPLNAEFKVIYDHHELSNSTNSNFDWYITNTYNNNYQLINSSEDLYLFGEVNPSEIMVCKTLENKDLSDFYSNSYQLSNNSFFINNTSFVEFIGAQKGGSPYLPAYKYFNTFNFKIINGEKFIVFNQLVYYKII